MRLKRLTGLAAAIALMLSACSAPAPRPLVTAPASPDCSRLFQALTPSVVSLTFRTLVFSPSLSGGRVSDWRGLVADGAFKGLITTENGPWLTVKGDVTGPQLVNTLKARGNIRFNSLQPPVAYSDTLFGENTESGDGLQINRFFLPQLMMPQRQIVQLQMATQIALNGSMRAESLRYAFRSGDTLLTLSPLPGQKQVVVTAIYARSARNDEINDWNTQPSQYLHSSITTDVK
ncbi:hypothetical protein ACTM5Z_004370 [Salmonella enterica]